jgi:flagellar basal-body rod protein FlgB
LDLLSSSVTETLISSLNGLSLRHKITSANIANAATPEYQRRDVIFEDQLKKALEIVDQQQQIKEQFSAGLNVIPIIPGLQAVQDQNPFDSIKPLIIQDNQSPEISNGNNVNIEKEMVDLTKNGTKYTIISEILGKKYQGMTSIIKQSDI